MKLAITHCCWVRGGFFLLLLAATPSYGQRRDLGPISTGRPDQTTGTTVIPKRTLQLESGLRYQHDAAMRAYNYPSLMVRYGLLDNLELRVSGSVQDSVPTDSNRRPRGIGPPELGARLYLWEQQGVLPEAAFTAAVTFPVGHAALRPTKPETRLRLGFSNSLSDRLTLTYTYGYGWLVGTTEQRYAVKLSAKISQPLAVYGEFFGTKESGSRAGNEADVGLLWLVRNNLQLDVAGGAGLNRAAPSFFVTTGASLRLPY